MRLYSVHSFRCAAVAASIAVASSIGHAQVPLNRPSGRATPPPVPTVVQPAEGQVVSGDLPVAVQVPPGVPARKYTIEAAYWDPARNAWVYPGTMGADFAGSAHAGTTIADEVRKRYNPAATRWRIHVRTVEPPGGWGPWREFTWQSTLTAPSAGESRPTPAGAPADTAAPTPPAAGVATGTTSPSAAPPDAPAARPAGTGTTLPNPGPPTAPAGLPSQGMKAAELVTAASARLKIDADAAQAPQGRQSLQSLQSSVVTMQQSLEYVISVSGSLLAQDKLKDLAALRDMLAALKEQEDSLKKLMAQQSDDPRARGALAQRLREIGAQAARTTEALGFR